MNFINLSDLEYRFILQHLYAAARQQLISVSVETLFPADTTLFKGSGLDLDDVTHREHESFTETFNADNPLVLGAVVNFQLRDWEYPIQFIMDITADGLTALTIEGGKYAAEAYPEINPGDSCEFCNMKPPHAILLIKTLVRIAEIRLIGKKDINEDLKKDLLMILSAGERR